MQVKEIMRRHPLIVHMDEPLAAIEKNMRDHGFSHLPVMDDGRVVGIVSDLDVKTHKNCLAGTDMASRADEMTLQLKAFQLMVREVYSVNEQTSVVAAAELMIAKQVHCLPVLLADGTLVGILTSSDIMRQYVQEHS